MLPLACQLQADGHEVLFISHPRVRNMLARNNLALHNTFTWGGYAVDLIEQKAIKGHIYRTIIKERKIKASFFLFVYGLEEAARSCLQVIDVWKPDVAVFDILFLPGSLSAELCSLPYASSCPVPSPLASTDLPPYSFGLPSNRKKLGFIYGALWKLSLAYWGLNTRYVNRVRRAFDLPPMGNIISDHASPYLYLSYTTERFEFFRSDLRPQVHYIGPTLNRKSATTEVQLPQFSTNESPLIYFTMGTLQGKRKVFYQMIEAARGAPWRVAMTVGDLFRTDSFGELPPNVTIANWLPQIELLSRSAAIVCHGGFNTVNDALALSVPLLVLPQAWDHFETAQRLIEAGAAIRLDPFKVSAKTLRTNIDHLLTTPDFAHAAQQLAEDFSRCDTARSGADLILQLAKTRRPIFRAPEQSPTVYRKTAPGLSI